MDLKIKKLNEKAILPTKGTEWSAGYDLSYCGEEDIIIPSGETVKVPTGLAMSIPIGFFGAIFARSGLSIKEGLRPANCVGVIDCDYRGEIIVALHNDGKEDKIISPCQRIAQIVFLLNGFLNTVEVEDLESTERGEGGFGSTGK